jgi:predicted ATPase
VDGFKNLKKLVVDFGPFTCIAGENAAGKSNLFDAIDFLALLADQPLMEAAQHVRSTIERRPGDPGDLFWKSPASDSANASASHRTMRLAAEMIVPGEVIDDFGESATPTTTFLRYEVAIGYEPRSGPRQLSGQLHLLHESLRHINKGVVHQHLLFPHSVRQWSDQVISGRRSGTAYISSEGEGEERQVKIHQDGGSRGRPRVASAARARSTVVSTITQVDDPTILAARREMQSWRRLALEPSAMRAPDEYTAPQIVESNGRHLAAALWRLAQDEDEPENAYARVAGRLAALTGLRVGSLRVDADESRETLTLRLTEASGIELSARSLSEGTLRFLALCVLLEDPTITGLICTEEPENGLHPANIPAMVQLTEDLAMDVREAPGPDNPFRQVLVNTHSPYFVQLVRPEDLLFADSRPANSDGVSSATALRLRPIRGGWRATDSRSLAIGKTELIDYLAAPPGAQLKLALEESPAPKRAGTGVGRRSD